MQTMLHEAAVAMFEHCRRVLAAEGLVQLPPNRGSRAAVHRRGGAELVRGLPEARRTGG